jgi:hypothetical protein
MMPMAIAGSAVTRLIPISWSLTISMIFLREASSGDFSKGGELRCPVEECGCFHTLDFDFKTAP